MSLLMATNTHTVRTENLAAIRDRPIREGGFVGHTGRPLVRILARKESGRALGGMPVAELLTMLIVRDRHREQGAPTSGYLANLALWDVEGQLVKKLAVQGLTQYSRHVNDITFSSISHVSQSRINWAVRTITKALATNGLRSTKASMRLHRQHIRHLWQDKRPDHQLVHPGCFGWLCHQW